MNKGAYKLRHRDTYLPWKPDKVVFKEFDEDKQRLARQRGASYKISKEGLKKGRLIQLTEPKVPTVIHLESKPEAEADKIRGFRGGATKIAERAATEKPFLDFLIGGDQK